MIAVFNDKFYSNTIVNRVAYYIQEQGGEVLDINVISSDFKEARMMGDTEIESIGSFYASIKFKYNDKNHYNTIMKTLQTKIYGYK